MSDAKDDREVDDDFAAYTPEEVADILKIDLRYLRRLMAVGRFPNFKVAGQRRVRKADLRAVMAGTWQPEGQVASADDTDDDPETTD